MKKRTYGGSGQLAKKRKTNETFSNSVSKRRIPLGRSLRTTHRYMEQNITVNPGVGGLAAEYFFSANGLYDPNVTGVGHQPLGFDNITAFFDHYVVTKAMIRATFHNTDTTNMQTVGIRIADDSTALASGAEIIENGNVNYATLTPMGGSKDLTMLSMEVEPLSWLGRSKNSTDVKGTSAANPSEQVMFGVFGFNTTGTDTGAVHVWVDIFYEALWIEPRELALS